MSKKHTVTLRFPNEVIADRFLEWLSNSGEQDESLDGLNFDYWSLNKNGDFGPNIDVTVLNDDEINY